VKVTPVLYLLVVHNLVLCVSAGAQDGWNKIESVEDVVMLYPDRARLIYPTREKVSDVEAKILRNESDMVTVLVKDEEKIWKISVPFSNSKNLRYTYRSTKNINKGQGDK
jgi:hypothetical protein